MARFVYEEVQIVAEVDRMGQDLCVRIWGGDWPHIGSVSIAEPRQSLDGSGRGAATVSTYNYVSHKDYFVSNPVAEELASKLSCRVVVVCGIHYDEPSREQLEKTISLAEQIVQDISQCYGK